MNITQIKGELKEFDTAKVDLYIAYLNDLATAKKKDGKPAYPFMQYAKDVDLVNLFKQVSNDGLTIDGDTITIQFKGKLMVSYNYQAYKNKLLMIYPETTFDVQNVYEGDKFTFKKASGKVLYNHEIVDPFGLNKKIIGCYAIIKNSRGEFIETLNLDEINKMKKVAKTLNIWNEWYGEMVLKSVMKRACKRHFKDIVTNIEKLDNENFDLEKSNVEISIQEQIENMKTIEELEQFYKDGQGTFEDETQVIKLLGQRKAEIQNENS